MSWNGPTWSARIYLADLAGATDILGSGWDEPGTDASPALEAQKDLAAADVVPLAKTLLVNLESLPEMPDKIEGVAVIDEVTVAVINDNDFAIGEFDEEGEHHGTGAVSQLMLIETPRLP